MSTFVDLFEYLRTMGLDVRLDEASGRHQIAIGDAKKAALAISKLTGDSDEVFVALAMAYERDRFVNTLANSWKGMVREGAKAHCAGLCNYHYNWVPEATKLAEVTLKFFDSDKIETKGYDRIAAGKAAYHQCMVESVSKVNTVFNLFAEKKVRETEMSERQFLRAYRENPADPVEIFWKYISKCYPEGLVSELKKSIGL